jgi:hypothetical protein
MLRHIIILLLAAVATVAQSQDLPLISRDASGNLHVTTELGATLFVNGVPVNTSAMALQTSLEERLSLLQQKTASPLSGVAEGRFCRVVSSLPSTRGMRRGNLLFSLAFGLETQ